MVYRLRTLYFVGVASAFALPACAFTTIDPVADMYRDGVSPEPGRQTLPTVTIIPLWGINTRVTRPKPFAEDLLWRLTC